MARTPIPVQKRPQTARYVVSVDGQAKSSFPIREEADAYARNITDRFPKVVVLVTDSEHDSVKMFEATLAAEVAAAAAEAATTDGAA